MSRLKKLKSLNQHKLALKALELEQKLDRQYSKTAELTKEKDSLSAKLDELEVAQLAFQKELVGVIELIEKRPFWKKIFGYRNLVNQLIATIRKGFKK